MTALIDGSHARNWLAETQRMILAGPERALNAATEEAYQSIQQTTLFKNQSGALRSSFEVTQPSQYARSLFSRKKYARFVEEGTPPHMIAARRKRALRFVWQGVVVFRRYVMHPGTHPRPFVHIAGQAGEVVLRQTLERTVDQAALH